MLPELVRKPKTAITPEQFEALLAEVPDEFRLMMLVAIETGVRWGELTALRPVDIDFTRNVLVRRVVLEVPKKISGADSGHAFRDFPKDNEYREVMAGVELCRAIREHMLAHGKREDDLLFSTRDRGANLAQPLPHAGVEAGDRAASAGPLPRPARRPRLVAARRRGRPQGGHEPPEGSLPDAGHRALAAVQSVHNRRP